MLRSLCLAALAGGFALAQNMPQPQPGSQWKFAISGDSRNCGDFVMPAIAAGVRQNGAEFYWHLGDFRAIYEFDEDLVPPPSLGLAMRPLNVADYLARAWPDFIAHQMAPFGSLPVYLVPGNHEMIEPMSRAKYLQQFADWLETPALREQRLKDNPADHKLRTYYHWIQGSVDFIALDNASPDQFDPEQMSWIRQQLARDEKNGDVRTIIVGMHEALPGSLAEAHGMEGSGQSDRSGRQVYEMLVHARDTAHKHVYVFASHGHFFMEDIFHSDTWKGRELPGWVIGTAGAQRYVLPNGVQAGSKAFTNVYGYAIVTVQTDGSISVSFERLSLDDLRKVNPAAPEPLLRWCYEQNHQ